MLSEMCFMLSFFYPTRRGDYDPTYRVGLTDVEVVSPAKINYENASFMTPSRRVKSLRVQGALCIRFLCFTIIPNPTRPSLFPRRISLR